MISASEDGVGAWRGPVGLLVRRELEEFLAASHLWRVAMRDKSAWPYVVPVWFDWDASTGVFWVIARAEQGERGHMAALAHGDVMAEFLDDPPRGV